MKVKLILAACSLIISFTGQLQEAHAQVVGSASVRPALGADAARLADGATATLSLADGAGAASAEAGAGDAADAGPPASVKDAPGEARTLQSIPAPFTLAPAVGQQTDLVGRYLRAASGSPALLSSAAFTGEVTITAPPGGSSYRVPVNIPVSASVSGSIGVVSRVDFFANGVLIGTDASYPYSITWTNAGGGIRVNTNYSITAVAYTVGGPSYTSPAVSILIRPPFATGAPAPPAQCKVANIVALDHVFFYNRLGALNPAGMIYALRRDIVPIDPSKGLIPGNVQLRPDKRPRPVVLRMNIGDCIRINFQNLLSPDDDDDEQGEDDHDGIEEPHELRRKNQPRTRTASAHVQGLQLVSNILDDGSFVGVNPSSLVEPGGATTYMYYAQKEGPYLMYSTAATTGGEGNGGSLANGLFGLVNVEPQGSEYYRSQITHQEMQWASNGQRDPVTGHPIINYNATYPTGHPFANKPIIKILDGSEIFHSDLNAIITGPNRGPFSGAGAQRPVKVAPNRNQPFREFSVIYHDEIKAVQAFPQFEEQENEQGEETNPLAHTLHSVRDAFAINYGTGGIGAEILANRFMVGPMHDCDECLYEEFFLSAWTVADPAMIVDVPANARDENGNLIVGPKAMKALFPEDPSNVHHSYINDHTRFRVVHAGPKEHHIHHLHAHQWLHTPNDDNSTYLDSQAIGPGSMYTMEITYNGGGNRNKTVGDAIFHCHFYPHFAMGMWELWRVHDTFEEGTALDNDGKPVTGARALPDGEIAAGTPIPAVVPIPTIAMAPMPSPVHIRNGQICFGQFNPSQPCNRDGAGVAVNPGFPFFIPGLAGHRPPHPPLDTEADGGLPRHIIVDGVAVHHENRQANFSLEKARLDFDKGLAEATAQELAETGTPIELVAMTFHEQRTHASKTPEGTTANFITNGRPRVAGAPYADPCVDDNGQQWIERLLEYKAAAFQFDIKLNKAEWHFPQQRILALWEDVHPTIDGERTPEPLFIRARTGDCIVFRHTNLVPRVYKLDDFQVRTPTDVVGQHIHLVKFDVTSSDGAGNGFNYEDGSFAPEEVVERIHAINERGGIIPVGGGAPVPLTVEILDAFPNFPGAQVTIQRWFADDVLNNNEIDRTLRTVFTHDHFGPSTHQQVGLYAGLSVHKRGAEWVQQETGDPLSGRYDGGPTSWRADIEFPNGEAEPFREFLLEFADFQHAYRKGGGGTSENPVPDPAKVINPPAKKEADFQPPFVLLQKMNVCPGTNVAPPCPEAISAADVGTMVVNYRNETIPHRIWNFNGIGDEPGPNDVPQQAPGEAGDLANVYLSTIERVDQRFNVQPTFYPPLTPDVAPKDPFTPLMRAYEDDRVEIRILVGAHEEGHNFSVNGIKWPFEPGTPEDPLFVNNSGWRNSQMMGISEHFEFHVPVLPMPCQDCTEEPPPFYDFRYAPGHAVDDQWNGMWGILRAFRGSQPQFQEIPAPGDDGQGGRRYVPLGTSIQDPNATTPPGPTLRTLSSNPDGRAATSSAQSGDALSAQPAEATLGGVAVCPPGGRSRTFNVSAYLARDLLSDGTLIYNPRPQVGGRLEDPTAIIYVRNEDIDATTGKLAPAFKVEPLILRAAAGECITLNLTNKIPEAIDLPGHNTLPMIIDNFNANQVKPSSKVGLHPQLLFYDVTRSDGMNVGFNPIQTANYNETRQYRWYAGDVTVPDIEANYTAVEFGATNLMPADPIKHTNKGAIGGLIIEPPDFSYADDMVGLDGLRTHAHAMVRFDPYRSPLREYVLLWQNDINMRFGERTDEWGNLKAVPNTAEAEDPEDSGQKAINYRTEPMWKRLGFEPDTPLSETRKQIFTASLSNQQVGGQDPVTPVFTASRGTTNARFRVLHPGGHARNNVFILHGHEWQELPYTAGSTRIGDNPLSEWKGSQGGHGPSNHFDVDLRIGAGGRFRVIGDYLYRDRASFTFDGGIWGIFRVE